MKSDSFEITQFRVARGKVDDTSSVPSTLRPVPKIPETQAATTRLLSLDEYRNLVNGPTLLLLNTSYWHDPITEKPKLNSTEIWSLVNPTDDAHPIHLHLVRFQILDRLRYDVAGFMANRQLRFLGSPIPPEPDEAG